MHCTMCQTTIGEGTKIQPTTVDKEVFCPGCFCTVRMHAEPERFNASQTAAVRCMLCGWLTVSFGVYPGFRYRCGQCGQIAGIKVRLEDVPLTPKESKAIEEIARASGIKDPPRMPRGVGRPG